MNKRSPQFVFGTISLLVTAVIFLVLYFWLGWNLYWLWLAAINVVTFVFYRLDKRRAQKAGSMRVPEAVLLSMMLFGGFIGAGIAMYMRPRHKVRKPRFVITLIVSFIAHIGLFYVFYLN